MGNLTGLIFALKFLRGTAWNCRLENYRELKCPVGYYGVFQKSTTYDHSFFALFLRCRLSVFYLCFRWLKNDTLQIHTR